MKRERRVSWALYKNTGKRHASPHIFIRKFAKRKRNVRQTIVILRDGKKKSKRDDVRLLKDVRRNKKRKKVEEEDGKKKK